MVKPRRAAVAIGAALLSAILLPGAAPAIAGAAPGSAGSGGSGAVGNIGSIDAFNSVDPSSLAAGAGGIGSTGSSGSSVTSGSGTLPTLGTGSQNTNATPPIGMEQTPITQSEVRAGTYGDPRVNSGDHRLETWTVASKSMNRIFAIEIWRARDPAAPAPMLYLLDGVDSPEPSGWMLPGNAHNIFADDQVTLVMPTGADGSLFADWAEDDPVLSRNKWETFLTEELPPLLEGRIPFNGKRGVAGLSMGAASAVDLAVRHPDMYESVGAISGCYTPTDDIGFLLTKITVETRGGNVANLWGPRNSPAYEDHNSVAKIGALRGKSLFFSAASGIPDGAEWDRNNHDMLRFVQGAAIEQATHACTVTMDRSLTAKGVDAQVVFTPFGLHNWDTFGPQVAPMRARLLPALTS
ncbi:alpha/beta hydrolase [Tomitella biformata]|uniref:alpha/beta hydrolase n=1 Tax=Tomitella biformata TaxID=630403 RepID=UPI000467B670|nr:alpha/beta hydrolase family protein [Tomitella biformata]